MMVLNQFDRIAAVYDGLARLVFGQRLTRAQEIYLSQILPRSRVLILGGGTGKIIGALKRVQPDCRVIFIEASQAMLQRAKDRNKALAGIEFIHGTEQSIPPGALYDVVITPFYLDMFPEDQLREVIKHVGLTLDIHGKWLVTDFYSPTTIGQRWLERIMYLFFRVTTGISAKSLPDWKASLRDNGWIEKNHARDGFIESAVFVRGQLSAAEMTRRASRST
ncbi:MAG: class I SAM-dependent methyltransferase [Cyclobacteriaceae bacterium]|nr:class I SAM-dependent methyltransferase [Cyclobacteriaceae bacterium]